MKSRILLLATVSLLIGLVITAGVIVAQGETSPGTGVATQSALGNGFTYQGRLDQGGSPANGNFDLTFSLFDASPGGAQVGATITLPDVPVDDGLFMVELDFGPEVFNGDARWLEVGVKSGGQPGPFTTLVPRQQITPTPYAMFAINSGSDSDWDGAGSGSLFPTNSADNVGIGTASPGEKFHILNGNFLMESDGEKEFRMIRTDLTDRPRFQLGRITLAGDLDPEFRVLYSDDSTVERSVFEFDKKGIVASVKPTVGSHFEGFVLNDSTPFFRLNSFPSMQLEMGPGGNTETDVVIRRASTDTLAFLTGGTERIRISSSGNVGIGTDSPNEQLQISGNLGLSKSTASTGLIKSGGEPFIHNFGGNNFFAGGNAGNLTMTGSDNTGVGVRALQFNTSGTENTAVGVDALLFNTTGTRNTAAGWQALRVNTTGGRNTATGRFALRSNTEGSDNTATGDVALWRNTTGVRNTAVGTEALFSNTTGINNTAVGWGSLSSNNTGSNNTAVGKFANVAVGDLSNATAIGANATVNTSNKIRLGDNNISVIEGQVAFTFTSDVNQKENFRVVDGEGILDKIGQMTLASWNYTGQDPLQFRHYGPTAQEFFAAFGDDGLGAVGTETTINSGDMAGIMMIAIQALEKRTGELNAQQALTAELEQLLREQQSQMQSMEDRIRQLEERP